MYIFACMRVCGIKREWVCVCVCVSACARARVCAGGRTRSACMRACWMNVQRNGRFEWWHLWGKLFKSPVFCETQLERFIQKHSQPTPSSKFAPYHRQLALQSDTWQICRGPGPAATDWLGPGRQYWPHICRIVPRDTGQLAPTTAGHWPVCIGREKEELKVTYIGCLSLSPRPFMCFFFCFFFSVCFPLSMLVFRCLSVYVRLFLSLAISSCASEYANLDYPNLNYPHNCNFDYLNTIEYYWILLTLFLSVPNCRLSLPLSFQIISFLKYGQLTCCKLVQRHFWCAGWCLF